jgi:hypothetical protein
MILLQRGIIETEKVQITTRKYSKSACNPLNYVLVQFTPLKLATWFNLPHHAICHFCFSIHKLNFKLRFCKMVVDIITYIRKIFCDFYH